MGSYSIFKMYVIAVCLLLALIASAMAQVPTFECNDYNNDCVGCVQSAPYLAFQCAYCPKDGVCHTVGSLFDQCDASECISLSKASQCEKDYIDACNEVKYGQPGFGYDRKPLFNETKDNQE